MFTHDFNYAEKKIKCLIYTPLVYLLQEMSTYWQAHLLLLVSISCVAFWHCHSKEKFLIISCLFSELEHTISVLWPGSADKGQQRLCLYLALCSNFSQNIPKIQDCNRTWPVSRCYRELKVYAGILFCQLWLKFPHSNRHCFLVRSFTRLFQCLQETRLILIVNNEQNV